MRTLDSLAKAHKIAGRRGRPAVRRTAKFVTTSQLVSHPNPAHAARTAAADETLIIVTTTGDTEQPPVPVISWAEARKRARAQLGLTRDLGMHPVASHAGPLPKKVKLARTDKHQPNFGNWYGSKLADLVENKKPSRSALRRASRKARGLRP